MLVTGQNRQNKMEFVVIDDLMPKDHLLRKIDKYIDFSFINEICRPYYCEDNGRPAVEPEIVFKLLFLGYLYGIRSETRLVEEVKVNIAYSCRPEYEEDCNGSLLFTLLFIFAKLKPTFCPQRWVCH